ncbi:ABC transporter permease [Vulgatibacter incomptus]|uniref:Transport permease protein n=1 Tax=Vulgatibacter incomptus TaxID=1391653 RepID=A0A0K1PGU8_9BACT|nr:ABC transporter permease [Vulgatibacter incomptus]AKU92344.1 ABC-2 type transporter [Vulgatibacter incomptus]
MWKMVQIEPLEGSALSWALADAWTIAKRNLTHIRHMPEKLADVTVQPVMFVLLFAYVFGSAIVIPGGNYREFLMPGIFTQSVIFATMGIMSSIVTDMSTGVMDRFRSLPISRSAVLVGHTFSSLLESLLGLTVMVICGLIVGWRAHTPLASVLGGFGLLLYIAFALSWIGVYVGLFLRTTEAAQGVGFVVIFPLTFLANTFVPTSGFPAWLRAIADWNPTSAFVAATRELFGNGVAVAQTETAWPLQHAVPVSIAWCTLVVAIFLPLAVGRFRRAMAS